MTLTFTDPAFIHTDATGSVPALPLLEENDTKSHQKR